MPTIELLNIVTQWYYTSNHTKNWLLQGIQFVARDNHSQKGYIFVNPDHVEVMRWHQYGGGKFLIYAADPLFFEKLDTALVFHLL